MHATGDYGSAGVPAFLHKLWSLVEDEDTNELIAWDPSGRSFHVFDQSRFSKEVLPQYFKHSNIASFIRQLNMYGFRKVSNIDHGSLKIEVDDMEFTHPYFQRGQEMLLEFIKRKVSNSKEDTKTKSNDVSSMLKDIHNLKDQQDDITTKMETVERENVALWREVATLRQKHHKQQQIVNKLIQFLITLVGKRGLNNMNRKRPLMLNDASELDNPTRPAKTARPYTFDPQPAIQVSQTQPLQVPSPPGVRIEEMVESPPPISVSTNSASTVPVVTTKAPPTYIVINTSRPVTSKNQPPAQTSVTNRFVPLSTTPAVAAPTVLASVPTVSVIPTASNITESSTMLNPSADSSISLASGDILTDVSDSISLGDILQPDETISPEQLNFLASEVQSNEIDPISSEVPTTSGNEGNTNTTRTVALTDYSKMPTSTVRDLSGELDQMQDSLEGIKDLLSIDPVTGVQGLKFDSDILSGWLNMIDSKPDFLGASSSSGKDLVQYNPLNEDIHSLFDLGIDFDNTDEQDDNDTFSSLGGASSLNTPSLDLQSPLAQRRKKKKVPTATLR